MTAKEFNTKLQELGANAKKALRELGDFIIENKEIGWRPAWGLTQGCIEQLDDAIAEAME